MKRVYEDHIYDVADIMRTIRGEVMTSSWNSKEALPSQYSQSHMGDFTVGLAYQLHDTLQDFIS